MVRTRFAPSPTGYMHIGNLRTALYAYLIARANNGKFVLRIEDTDQARQVEGSIEIIYNTLKLAGITHDEGPDVGGPFGPYIQSERKNDYLVYAKELVQKGKAYYCFCSKERLETLQKPNALDAFKYDRHCHNLSQQQIEKNLAENMPYVIRQLIPEGTTTYKDEVFGTITFDNKELDDQVLIKSDGMPTYNFANVVDDHAMNISHVIRGCEYLTSTPKYNLLYEAFGWPVPIYVHLPLLHNEKGEKLSKRRGDASFEDLLEMGFLAKAIVNYVVFLGWTPETNEEIFSLSQLEKIFSLKGMSKSPSTFDLQKLTWFNGEYMKRLSEEEFFNLAKPELDKAIKRNVNKEALARMAHTRVNFAKDVAEMFDFVDAFPEYDTGLFVHKKSKTDETIALSALSAVLPHVKTQEQWDNDAIYAMFQRVSEETGMKNSQILWALRTALSGKPVTPCGASELAEMLGKEETIQRIEFAIVKLNRLTI